MVICLLLAWGAVMLLLGRWMCGNWLNHLSVYTITWTTSLCAYELHWVRYNSISAEAWLYIFLAWIGIYLGTAIVMVRGLSSLRRPMSASVPRLKLVIVVFSLFGVASCFVLARQIAEEVDPNLLVALTVGAPQIYAAEFEETGKLVGIPYLGFLPYAACALAGFYVARRGRIDWVSILPLVVAGVAAILSVSRWEIMLAMTLFLLSLFVAPKVRPISLTLLEKTMLFLGFAAGLVLVSFARTDLSGSFAEQSEGLNQISEWFPPAPSTYFYVSAPPVGFSQYLREPTREANFQWGRYTFASLYRFSSKLGLSGYVPFHQEFYSTPEPVNTCTYLREVYSDFGGLGIFVFPFLLGATASWLSISKRTLVRTVLLAHVYVVVLFSFTYLVVITGQWFQSAMFSVVAAMFIERFSHRADRKGEGSLEVCL